MEFAIPPEWDLPPAEAVARQKELAARVSLEDRLPEVELIAGVDLAAGRSAATGRGAVVVWRLSDGSVVESCVVERPLTMPYIPGLLALREGPVVEAALRELRSEPDVIMMDGAGIDHPRGLGIASHLGLLLDRPAVGVAKSRLWGRAEEPGPEPGDRTPLLAPDGRQIGVALRSRARSKPLFVSPGHHVSVETAAELVVRCLRGHRLPEPTHLADRLSKERSSE